MKKYALINNNIVTDIIEIEETDLSTYISSNDLVIDITDINPQPMIRWVLNGNQLTVPVGLSDREQFEIKLASQKTDFGIKLARISVDRIGARNKILNKTGEQVSAILTSLIPVKMLLETGALGTARHACSQLKFLYTEYADIFQFVINEINIFEGTNGL